MVRISDARMSGTAFGTIVLHVTPEAAIGGPLALVRDGDRIRLDVARAASSCSSTTPSSRGAAKRSPAPRPPAPRRRPSAATRRSFHRIGAAGRRGLRLRFPRPRPGGARAMSEPLAAVARAARAPAGPCLRQPSARDRQGRRVSVRCAAQLHARAGEPGAAPRGDDGVRASSAPCSSQPSVYGTDNRCMLDALRAGGEPKATRCAASPCRRPARATARSPRCTTSACAACA